MEMAPMGSYGLEVVRVTSNGRRSARSFVNRKGLRVLSRTLWAGHVQAS
jgi:hypothetical protein